MNKTTKIAITGGAGYIGSFTTKYLKDLGFENLVILDNFSTGYKNNCFTRYHEVDLLDKEKLNDIFKEEQFESVIHFAALSLVGDSMQKPEVYFRHNYNTSLNLLDAMQKNGTKNIVFSSSCSVYGSPEKMPLSEGESIKPQSIYAETKVQIERLIFWYKEIYGFNYAVLRYFNACGATPHAKNGELHQPETHLIPAVSRALIAGKNPVIFGKDYPTKDGTCVRDYIHVEDLASAHHLALQYITEKNISDVFNLGTGTGRSNLEVVQAILEVAKEMNITGEIEYKDRRWGDAIALYADNAKAKKILGWDPKHTDISEVVKDAFMWQYEHKDE